MPTNILVALLATIALGCSAPATPPDPVSSEPKAAQLTELATTASAHATEHGEAMPGALKGAAPTKATGADNPGAFTRVEPSKVCMVNNQYMGREQIPVTVEGKTYFGCCAMCEAKLAKEPGSRLATDPISGKTVDKAVAVIGSEPSGAVHYFENEKNFEAYASR